MIDRGNSGKAIGERLLGQSNTLFHLWHQFREGKLSRVQFQEAMTAVREAVRLALQRGKKCRCSKTAGTCKELLGHEEWPWAFGDVEGVEPTNNEAERTERQGVLWRKTSGGTDSLQGNRFGDPVLRGVHPCRRQGKNLLDYLNACIQAWRHDRTPPSLIPAPS